MLVSNASITAQKRLHINTSSSAITGWCMTNGATGSTATDGFHGEISATGVPSLVNKESSAIEFYTNNTTLSLTVNNGGGITIPNANNATVGTTTNGAVIDTLRGLTLYGNASNWMDCKGTDVVRVSGSNIPDWTLFRNGLYGYTYGTAAGNVLDESFSKFQLDHNWDTTKKIIYPHFHLAHNVATVGATDSIYLCYEYSVSNSTNVFPATSTQCRAIKVPTVQYSQFFGSGFSITIPNNTGMSPIVWTRWYRDQANARDNANYPIFITDVDAHYRVNSLGSNNELQK
jgi:hypothetical protein